MPAFDGIGRQRERRAGKADERHAPPSARVICRIASSTYDSASRGSNRLIAARSASVRSGFSIAGPSPWMKSKRTAEWFERKQQIENRMAASHVEPADRLERHFGRQVRGATDIQQGIALAQRAVLGHVPPGLTHEPHGGGIDRLAPAGFEEPAARLVQCVTLSRFRARPTRSSSHKRLESQLRAELAKLGRHGIVEEIIPGDDGDRYQPLFVVSTESPKEPEAVDQRHAQVEDDRVRMTILRFLQSSFGVDLPFGPGSPRAATSGQRLRDAFVVVDDQNFRRAFQTWAGNRLL
jgi:hypothetical protein